jgi:hypothetical protein
MEEMGNAYSFLVGKHEGTRPLRRHRRGWEDNIKMNRSEIGLGRCGLDASGSEQGPVAGSYKHGHEPSGSIKRRGIF